MSTTEVLREAETDLAELAGLPGSIRDRVKAGVTELKRLRDAIDAEIGRLTGGAQITLASLQKLSATPEIAGPAPDAPAGSFGG